MSFPSFYGQSLALLTDLYQLTMAYAYWKANMLEHEAVFYLFFRKRPFKGSMAITAGLETAIDFLEHFHYDESDLNYLKTLNGADGKPLFEQAFIDYLSTLKFTCDVDAMPEGTPAFPYEPLIRVKGPILQAQLLESPLLNIINFQTLIATKAERICWAARPDPVVEFGMRRAQGIDGAMAAARAAFIGGCESTSHVLAGKVYGIPVKGTHAHSWIMAFDQEKEAFRIYSEVMPNNCIFLIDTYDSVKGAKRAVEIGKQMRAKGQEMIGVRLDSGDLAHLSIEVRKILDQAGFENARIMASNELDEYLIRDLKQQGAQISIWGVGTNLITAKDQPALDGVYKLAAIKKPGGEWEHRLKTSEQIIKVTTPGILQVRRYKDQNGCFADMIYDELTPFEKQPIAIDPLDPSKTLKIQQEEHTDLLVPIYRRGKCVYQSPALMDIQKNTHNNLEAFPKAMRRFYNPPFYLAGLEKNLYDLKLKIIKDEQESAV